MNKRRVLWMVGGATVAVAATSALAWWAWNGGRAAWWATASMWELDESQRAATEACGELDWLGSLRVLHQDQTVACEPSWFAHTVQPHLKGVGHRARVRWLQQVYADPASNERTRFRSGQALIVAGLPAPGFAMLTRSPTLHAARDELVQMVAEDRILPEGWADPEILSEAAVHELDDERAVPVVVSLLRHESLFDTGDTSRRAWMADAALDQAGLGDGMLELILQRQQDGLPLHELTTHAVTQVVNHGAACRERSSAACLWFAADMLESTHDDEAHSAPVPTTSPLATLWMMLDASRPHATVIRGEWLADVQTWVAAAPDAQRAERIIGLVTGGIPAAKAIGAGDSGDPSLVLRRRSGGPWMTALMAQHLASATEVPSRIVSDGVRVGIDVGGVRVWVDDCGAAHAVAPETEWSESWPPQAVLAQATAEAAQAAARRKDQHAARRLAGLARSWDPQGVTEVQGLTEGEPSNDEQLGRGVALHLARPQHPDTTELHTGRAAWASRRSTGDPAATCGAP